MSLQEQRTWRSGTFCGLAVSDLNKARQWYSKLLGSEGAMVLVWRRLGDKARLFWAAEGGPETADPGFVSRDRTRLIRSLRSRGDSESMLAPIAEPSCRRATYDNLMGRFARTMQAIQHSR